MVEMVLLAFTTLYSKALLKTLYAPQNKKRFVSVTRSEFTSAFEVVLYSQQRMVKTGQELKMEKKLTLILTDLMIV